MSREERKMAQIIASIERMEQETRATGDDPNQDSHCSRQGGRGKKGKKAKPSAGRGKYNKKIKVVAVTVGMGDVKTPIESNLTPKKRWIQLWNAQMGNNKENFGSPSESPEDATKENRNVEAGKLEKSSATSPVVELKVTSLAVLDAPPKVDDREILAKSNSVTKQETKQESASFINVSEAKRQEQTTELQDTEETKDKTSSSLVDLRVKTPLSNESSHLSPPLERNSPTTTASISPSAKIKDSDLSSNNSATASGKCSPVVTKLAENGLERKDSNMESVPKLEKSIHKSDDSSHTEASDHLEDNSRKRSLERNEPPLSEEAKRRADRRRQRKSNWDVGDPRNGGSPVAKLPVSAAAAAANQQSFASYPAGRPSYRHSQSMMDMKPQFSTSHRPSSSYSNIARRGFNYPHSMPLDRSWSTGRPSMRYNSNSGSYR